MTDTLLWSVFVALLTGALYVAWPRPPAWDPTLFHHLVLASFYRGELEAVGGTLEAWRAKLAAALPVGPKPPSGGWTEDPDLLGEDYSPAVRLGAGVTWDTLAAREAPLAAAVARRLEDVRVVWFGDARLTLPGVRVHQRPGVDLAVLEEIEAGPATRFVLATATEGAALLRALSAAPGVRDRVRALLFVDATFDPDWNTTSLTQDTFDTEIDRVTPWFVLRARDTVEATLPEPPVPPTGRRSFAVHDLGLAPAATLADPALAESVVVVLAALA